MNGAIHLARLDKTRPVLVLTRQDAMPFLSSITVIPITSSIHGVKTEVLLGRHNGLDRDCVANCNGITTIPASDLGRCLGFLPEAQEPDLARAIAYAFDLN